MGSEQSSVPPKRLPQRAPPVRRGHTIAVSNVPGPDKSEVLPIFHSFTGCDTVSFFNEKGKKTAFDAWSVYSEATEGFKALEIEVCRSDPSASGNNSPGASVCSDSELPYISYTVDRPIGDSPKNSAKTQRASDNKKSLLQRRQLSLQARKGKRTRDIVVVKQASDTLLDEDIRRLQEIPTFLPIMRGTLGLPGARDPEVLEGLDYRPWVRLTARLQAHLAACSQPIAAEEFSLASKMKEADSEVSRLYAMMVDRQRANARHAERLSRVHEVAHQLSRCNSLLNQTLQDIEELNQLLPEGKRLDPFVWSSADVSQ